MKRLPLLLVIAAAPALADACGDAAQRIATEVGNAYAIRTGPVITIKRGRRTFHYTLECADGQPSMVSGDAGSGTDMGEFGRTLERATSLVLDVPENVARSALDKCARLARRHGMDGAATTDDALAVSCTVVHDWETFEIRRR
ncbi:hypothetical protein MKK70_10380 [Methylobacterium sp. E-041]|uniref:hypothetical protein n=1 Tax=Methylobacterium sp. E-041 TaxID=2836573 RepID=UPI001FB94149|nr:hypothetical protein [Methylobacterium sp. E-041]MCJ2105770.1 hypothetical protein [Methylobacterium sp. E-041]